jgi:hypothetical protein
MSRALPAPGCLEIAFGRTYVLGDAAEVALEDYARALAAGRAAEAVADAAPEGGIKGVHVCEAAPPGPLEDVKADIEGFARELAAHGAGASLGWE